MMKFIVVCLLFIGCVAAATNSSSSTGQSSTGVSSESSSSHAFNTSSTGEVSSSTGLSSSSSEHNATFSSTGEASSSTGLSSSSSSEHNATFSSSSSEHNDSSSSTGQDSSSTGVWSSSTGSIPTPTPTPSPCGIWFATYGNTSETAGNFSDPAPANTLINNNTYIAVDGWVTSISVVYHESSPSPVLLKRIIANSSSGITWYSSPDYVNVTGLINSTAVQTVNLTQALAVKKGDFLGLFSATGTFGLNGLTDGYVWCTGNIQNDDPLCYPTTTEQVRIGFTLKVDVPCPSSSTGAAPNTTSSSTGEASSSSISSSSGNPSNSSSTGGTPTTHAPTLPPTSSSSTGAAPTEAPHPEPQEASTSKSVTAVGFVVGAASMLGAVLLVFGVCWYMKRNQNTSTMNSPLLSHA